MLGDIKNSQSLNRYAYVQGNPITYTDPFGTNPLKAASKVTYGLLDVAAFFGLDVADLANAGLYLLEGNKDEAKLYLLAAIPIAGGLVAGAKGIRKLTKLSKTAKVVDRVGDAASDAYRSGRKINNYVDDVGEVLNEGKKNSSKGRKLVDKLKDKARKVKNKVTPKKKNGVGVVGVQKSGTISNPSALRYNRDGAWISNQGIIYGQGSKEGNRVKHVLQHTVPNDSKPLHTLYNVDKSEVIGLIDEAWVNKGQGILQSNGKVLYDINMGKTIGTNGEDTIRIITNGYSNNIITSFPLRKGVN